jgi:hypothetical protein
VYHYARFCLLCILKGMGLEMCVCRYRERFFLYMFGGLGREDGLVDMILAGHRDKG